MSAMKVTIVPGSYIGIEFRRKPMSIEVTDAKGCILSFDEDHGWKVEELRLSYKTVKSILDAYAVAPKKKRKRK